MPDTSVLIVCAPKHLAELVQWFELAKRSRQEIAYSWFSDLGQAQHLIPITSVVVIWPDNFLEHRVVMRHAAWEGFQNVPIVLYSCQKSENELRQLGREMFPLAKDVLVFGVVDRKKPFSREAAEQALRAARTVSLT